VTNISVGGCYVRMKRPFLRGARMHLTILLSEKTLAFRSIVRHAEPDSGMGLEFIAEDADGAATTLLDWLRRNNSEKKTRRPRSPKNP